MAETDAARWTGSLAFEIWSRLYRNLLSLNEVPGPEPAALRPRTIPVFPVPA